MIYENLFAHIEQKVRLTPTEKEQISSFFRVKKLRKRQFLLQEEDVCKDFAFVSHGLLKSYVLDEKGNENINLFGWEGWWIADFQSFLFQSPATLAIEAIEDCELLLLSRENYDQMLEEVPAMERYFRLVYERSLATKDQRLVTAQTYSAEEKYNHLIQTYPELIQRIPQSLLASFLGLTPETFSRIKHKKRE
ncbi:Crp/Fnr family transcriptional regulator [Myroides odoratus]|uniref:Cyclic nucleotide-binding domain n=1 Tax=Myroides odoratus TaxID=256 RepID=A0A378U367_MYROD|nr:Crp/Fnr family transcriptional regulator [Myroides odoratus]MCS4237256.1 CRP-like cAMP-binding protein [Myroides odoratus]MDH6602016.1 CRP-like cAMP-binding protein [Myroides gitamensis]QQU03179.1 Crp/Fnr family transcriptional regulator [Myroides odoratus]STZ69567.1 Cyclic nucleotide-binding domain [Myroides odoratus]